MNELIAQLKSQRARMDAAIAALEGVEPIVVKPRRGRPARKPVESATEIHLAATPAEKVSKSVQYDWDTAHAAGFRPKKRPSRVLVARAERILAKQRQSA